MNTLEQEVRKLRKKGKSWLAILTYNISRGNNNRKLFSRRLRSLYEPVLKSEMLNQLSDNFIQNTPSQEKLNKKRVLSRLTPNKIAKKISKGYEFLQNTEFSSTNHDSPTLLKFIITWAVLTDQPPTDFIGAIFPRINRLYNEWFEITGNAGFSDEEVRNNPEAAARFWSGVIREIIRKTPEENLSRLMNEGIQLLISTIGSGNFGKEFSGLINQATDALSRDTSEKIVSAFESNPNAKSMVNIPELEALVQREEETLEWSNNGKEKAVKTLQKNLSPELIEAVRNRDEVIRASIESMSRRGLLNNLESALKGQLKQLFIQKIWHNLQNVYEKVTSIWEYEDSPSTKEQKFSIREWLFRR